MTTLIDILDQTTPTQRALLTAAGQRGDHVIDILALGFRGGAITKVRTKMVQDGLARHDGDLLIATDQGLRAVGIEPGAAADATSTVVEADADGCEPETIGPYGEDDIPGTEDPGFFGAEPAAAEEAPAVALTGADGANEAEPGTMGAPETDAAPVAPAAAKVRKARADTKQALLIEMLKRPEGATVAQIAEATGWLHHTIRGAISGALKKKLGLTITAHRVRMVGPNREGAPGSYTIYRIAE